MTVNHTPTSLLPWSFHGTKYLGSTNLENQNNPPWGRSHFTLSASMTVKDRPGIFKSKFYRLSDVCSWWPEQQSLGGKVFCPWQTWKCVSIRKLRSETRTGKIIPAKELIEHFMKSKTTGGVPKNILKYVYSQLQLSICIHIFSLKID